MNVSTVSYFVTMDTKLKILKEIYVNDGVHARELSRHLNLSMSSIKNSLNDLSNLLRSKKKGRSIIYYPDYSKRELIPYIYLIEYYRISQLPKKIQYAVYDYLRTLNKKPLLGIIFGSYAKKEYTQHSDLDLFLVDVDENEAEKKAKSISMKYGITLSPVYLDYKTFSNDFFNQKKSFFQDLKKNKIIITGVEWWVELKNEET